MVTWGLITLVSLLLSTFELLSNKKLNQKEEAAPSVCKRGKGICPPPPKYFLPPPGQCFSFHSWQSDWKHKYKRKWHSRIHIRMKTTASTSFPKRESRPRRQSHGRQKLRSLRDVFYWPHSVAISPPRRALWWGQSGAS